MVDALILFLATAGAATGAAVLLRRRARRVRASLSSITGAGARRLAEALCPTADDPLPVAGPAWKSLAETLEPCACEPLRHGLVAPFARPAADPPASVS